MSSPLNFREDAKRLERIRRLQRSADAAAYLTLVIGIAVLANVIIGALAARGF